MFKSEDPIIDIILKLGGIKPLQDGTYAIEIFDIPYPYKDTIDGVTITRACKEIDVLLDIFISEYELIEKITQEANNE